MPTPKKQKNVKLIMHKNATGFYFSILSANGKNLNPSDIQKKKQSVCKSIGSLVSHIQSGAYEIIDSTKKLTSKTKK